MTEKLEGLEIKTELKTTTNVATIIANQSNAARAKPQQLSLVLRGAIVLLVEVAHRSAKQRNTFA